MIASVLIALMELPPALKVAAVLLAGFIALGFWCACRAGAGTDEPAHCWHCGRRRRAHRAHPTGLCWSCVDASRREGALRSRPPSVLLRTRPGGAARRAQR